MYCLKYECMTVYIWKDNVLSPNKIIWRLTVVCWETVRKSSACWSTYSWHFKKKWRVFSKATHRQKNRSLFWALQFVRRQVWRIWWRCSDVILILCWRLRCQDVRRCNVVFFHESEMHLNISVTVKTVGGISSCDGGNLEESEGYNYFFVVFYVLKSK